MASALLKDKDYDIISVIYHASQGCETRGSTPLMRKGKMTRKQQGSSMKPLS
jgi:hypothetical protein